MRSEPLELDVLILGGGAAGLWLLDELVSNGYSAVLLERDALGAGQTVASQGIIHGGIKYTLSGSLTRSARAIREMPERWRWCLEGHRRPHLSGTRLLSECCYLWRTASLKSRMGMVGARVGLRSGATRIDRAHVPDALRASAGDVFRVDEQVIDAVSFVADLAAQHPTRLLHTGRETEVDFVLSGPGRVDEVSLKRGDPHVETRIRPKQVVLSAGAGNEELRTTVRLGTGDMQRRPLHMVLARGDLPALYGHCVDGARTRATITTTVDGRKRNVWQIGGQIAEKGVAMASHELIEHAKRELRAVLPAMSLDGIEWATYRIDRAEGKTSTGLRPEGPSVLSEGNVITGWPTKLALAPELARSIAARLEPPAAREAAPAGASAVEQALEAWPRPGVAKPPWEVAVQWRL